MSVVEFSRCQARPPMEGKTCWLNDHLEQVACAWGDVQASYDERLYFLGGLCHDAAKARKEWQYRIDAETRPVHALPSALLFSYYACALLDTWDVNLNRNEKSVSRTIILRIIRDICDHHTDLRDIEPECPWHDAPNQQMVFSDMDLAGFHAFLGRYFDEFSGRQAALSDELKAWKTTFASKWSKWRATDMAQNVKKAAKLQGIDNDKSMERLLSFRDKTAAFIARDRFDAAKISTSNIDGQMADQAVAALERYCINTGEALVKKDAAAREMVEKRQKTQADSLQQYRDHSDKRIFALALPTGLGKTLTSIRIALEACSEGRASRIIYVAPYISILSQASNEIADATQLEVLQHHHLSVLSEDSFDDRDVLIMESWQAPVVTTTFNQLFKALFPKRAQDLIRLPAMQDAFVIIDEPQVIDNQVWNLFLAQIETALVKYNCSVVFISATLPPFEFGLRQIPQRITASAEIPDRYAIHYSPNVLGELDTARCLVDSKAGSICSVLNTVRDSCEVFSHTKKLLTVKDYAIVFAPSLLKTGIRPDSPKTVLVMNLNGLMTPIHKEFVINVLGHALKSRIKDLKIIAISTQIIEAGVNLSFQEALRMLAIMPPHIQLAGRVNRHGEIKNGKGNIYVVNFKREGTMDSRKWVYQSDYIREETDVLMKECDSWDEKTSLEKLNTFYKQIFERNREQALLGRYPSVARGEWSLFAGIEPFKNQSYDTYPIFIPWPDRAVMCSIKEYYDKNKIKNNSIQRVLAMMHYFNLEDVEDIYEMYLDKEKMASLEFIQRRRFMALLQQFVVQVGAKLGNLGVQTYNNPILRLSQKELYSLETGLGHHVGYEDKELYF